MEVHLEQKQESGFLAKGITKLHCSQIPEIPIQSPIDCHLSAGQALKNHPQTQHLPHRTRRFHISYPHTSVSSGVRVKQPPPQGRNTNPKVSWEVPEVWLDTRLHHEVSAGVCFIIFRVRPRCCLQSTVGEGYCSNQLISTQFWGGAGPLLQLQHLHWTSQHSVIYSSAQVPWISAAQLRT